ncbi:dithiol-disulfide isomerase [Streptomyces chumphonensis]|uniref:DsbA family protein n=1 Tax=Streptomyces chumphonensis TaxID=1214925 RepID=A0A927F2Z5_9ACTN|nr:DsbA family protein [Streptomyces chumphonensis]MBD3933427.1 DsbA family protein [Streptomyces chumphonensis]
MRTDAHRITVYSDIGCPWASLALHHLRRAAREEGVEPAVDHRAFPLELFNARPTPKHILDPEVAAVAAVEPALRWRPWSRPDAEYAVTTLLAMEAVQAVKHLDGYAASDQLDAALRHALYAESRCVSVHTEVVAVAARCPLVDAARLEDALRRGTHRADVFAQWEESRSPAVQGSPHLFLPDGSDVHNPGIAFTWPDGAPAPVITAYDPSVWNRLVKR